jgi:hypothetical protein
MFMPDIGPVFYLQIVTPDGVVARIPGGGRLEIDLIESCVLAIVARGVGFGRSEAHVADDIRTGMREALMGLKLQTVQLT